MHAQVDCLDRNRRAEGLVNASGVEPLTVFAVQPIEMLHILATNQSEHSMDLDIVTGCRIIDDLQNLAHQLLVCSAVFFEVGISVSP